MGPSTSTTTNTSTFQAGDTASGVASKLGMTPAQFLSYNPDLAATGHPNDYKGLTGLVGVGQSYNVGPKQSAIAVSSSPSRINTAQNTSSLNSAINSLNTNPPDTTSTDGGTDPVISALTNLHANSDAATKSLLASTMAQYQNKMNTVNKSYENYKSGLMSLGIEHNAAQGTPELLAGQIHSVANEEAGKISSIQADMSKALINAKTASDNNDFKTLNAEMTRYKQLQTEKQNAIKNMYSSITTAKTASTAEAANIYSTLQTLDPADRETFIQSVATKYGLPLDALVSAVSSYSQTQEGKALTLAKKKAGSSGKTGGSTANAVSTFTDKMEEIKGSDNFIDPYQWINARTEWQKAGHSASSFNSNFKQYLNPASYKIAGFKGSTASSSSGRKS